MRVLHDAQLQFSRSKAASATLEILFSVGSTTGAQRTVFSAAGFSLQKKPSSYRSKIILEAPLVTPA